MSFAETALKNTIFFPYWLDNKDAPEDEPCLTEDTAAQLVIVGGGFTGLWAAIQAKEADPNRSIILIEAGKVAYGASGRPGAIVSTSVMHGLSNAARIFPNDLPELERLGQENMDGFLSTLARYGIDCDHEWGGELTVGVGPGCQEILQEEHDLNITHGHDVILLDQDAVQKQVNSPLFKGAVWSKQRSGTLNPAKLAWGLKAVALKLGVRLYENTPLNKVSQSRSFLTIFTPLGEIKAEKILLATNAFAAGHRRIRRRVAAIRDRLIATEPLSDAQLAQVGWHNRQGVYDTRTQMNYMRMTKDNRIIFGGRLGYYFGNDVDPAGDKKVAPYIRLAEAFHQTFPQLDGIRFSHAWSGPIALTTRMAVHFQSYFGGRMIYAGGYSGFGVSASRFGARVGLAILDNQELPEKTMEFACTEPGYIPPEPFRWFGAKITLYAMDTADKKGGWRRPWINFVEKLGFPLT